MAYKVRESEPAREDLDRILSYIVCTLKNVIAARALFNAIEKAFVELSSTPKKYMLVEDPELRAAGYRKLFVKNYVIIYTVDDATSTVQIVRYFHTSQDYEKYL